jgi:hypothetical protein
MTAEKEMRRLYTARLIAMMTDQGLKRDRADPSQISRTMNTIATASMMTLAIASTIMSPDPQATVRVGVGTRATEQVLTKGLNDQRGRGTVRPAIRTTWMKIPSAATSAALKNSVLFRDAAGLTDTHDEAPQLD